MRLLAIDPGNEQSAWIVLDDHHVRFGNSDQCQIAQSGIDENQLMASIFAYLRADHLAIETLKPRGMPTSFEEMQTQLWAGRFIESSGLPFTQCFRHAIKMHHCGRGTANDSNIRRAMIDRFGGDNKAIGGAKCRKCKGKGWFGGKREVCPSCNGDKWLYPPGPLHGIHDDLWSALAIGTYWHDTQLSATSGGR